MYFISGSSVNIANLRYDLSYIGSPLPREYLLVEVLAVARRQRLA